MRPVLFEFAAPTLPVALILLVVVLLAVGGWLLLLRRRAGVTRDHQYTAAAIAGMAALILFILTRMPMIRINAYGAMLMLGFLGGTYTAIRLGRRRGIPAERLIDLGLVILIGAVVGARLMYMALTHTGPFIDINAVLQNGLGGLSFYGGILGALITGGIYIHFAKLPFWRVADAAAPAVALGYAVTRIGCFLNGCCYGKYAGDLPWAMNFLHSPDGPVYHVHPTQLYASLMGFLIFGILLFLARGNGLERAGRLFMVYLMLEGIERFVMEIFRQPDAKFAGFHLGADFVLTPAMLVCLLLIPLAIVGWAVLPKRPAVLELQPAPTPPPAPARPHAKGKRHAKAATR